MSITPDEKINAAAAFIATATLNASTISSRVAPCLIAASVWVIIQPPHYLVTATSRAISSLFLIPALVELPGSLIHGIFSISHGWLFQL